MLESQSFWFLRTYVRKSKIDNKTDELGSQSVHNNFKRAVRIFESTALTFSPRSGVTIKFPRSLTSSTRLSIARLLFVVGVS